MMNERILGSAGANRAARSLDPCIEQLTRCGSPRERERQYLVGHEREVMCPASLPRPAEHITVRSDGDRPPPGGHLTSRDLPTGPLSKRVLNPLWDSAVSLNAYI